MSQAQQLANDGYFVVAGWINSSGSGHVAVIVPGREYAGGTWNYKSAKVPNTMDTGAGMRAVSQPISHSFGKTKQKDVKFFRYK